MEIRRNGFQTNLGSDMTKEKTHTIIDLLSTRVCAE